jgi:hypothetical protein
MLRQMGLRCNTGTHAAKKEPRGPLILGAPASGRRGLSGIGGAARATRYKRFPSITRSRGGTIPDGAGIAFSADVLRASVVKVISRSRKAMERKVSQSFRPLAFTAQRLHSRACRQYSSSMMAPPNESRVSDPDSGTVEQLGHSLNCRGHRNMVNAGPAHQIASQINVNPRSRWCSRPARDRLMVGAVRLEYCVAQRLPWARARATIRAWGSPLPRAADTSRRRVS